jgi:hypothetical protein
LSAENDAEPVVAQQVAGRLMGGINAMGGVLMLTDRRLVFVPLISKAGLKLSNKAAKASQKLHDWDFSPHATAFWPRSLPRFRTADTHLRRMAPRVRLACCCQGLVAEYAGQMPPSSSVSLLESSTMPHSERPAASPRSYRQNSKSLALRSYRWTRREGLKPPGPPERQGSHDTRQLHAMAPGLVGQTIERAGGDKQDATCVCRCQDPSG